MKKVLLIISYWMTAIVMTALLLVSLDYDFTQAAVMSLTFLPSALALSFLLPKVDRSKSRKSRMLDSIYIVLGVMTIAFLLIFTIQTVFIFMYGHEPGTEWSMPSMLRNPVFVAIVLAALAYGNYLLVKRLDERFPSTKPITFTSDYRKVSLKKEDILYVESRDSEVWIAARDGQNYRNKMGITQWENLLGTGFLRIHRAFLVNKAEATLPSPDSVCVGGHELPVSRKYKEAVKAELQDPS
jgi:uncharacterized membrane protein